MRAHFGWRLLGWFLDYLITGIVPAIAIVIMIAALPRQEPRLCEDFEGDLAVCEPLTGSSVAILALLGIAWFLFIVIVWWGMLVGQRGQTPGRMAAGIKVVDIRTGEPIGTGRGIGRGFMGILSYAPFCIPGFYLGYLWMLWDSESQTWHDKVVSSVVIKL